MRHRPASRQHQMEFSERISPHRSRCPNQRNPHRWMRITCRPQCPARMFIPHIAFHGVAKCPGTRSSLLGCKPLISNGRSRCSRRLQPSIRPRQRPVRKLPRSLGDHGRQFRSLRNRQYRDLVTGSRRCGMRNPRVSPIGNPLITSLVGMAISAFGRVSSGRTAKEMLRIPSRHRLIPTVRCVPRMICDLLLPMTDPPLESLWPA